MPTQQTGRQPTPESVADAARESGCLPGWRPVGPNRYRRDLTDAVLYASRKSDGRFWITLDVMAVAMHRTPEAVQREAPGRLAGMLGRVASELRAVDFEQRKQRTEVQS